MSRYTTEGCERLAQALSDLAAAHGLTDMNAVAVSYYHWEAAVFEPSKEQWSGGLYGFLLDVLGEAESDLANVRVDEKHGWLGLAVVPLTGERAADLAERLEKVASRRHQQGSS